MQKRSVYWWFATIADVLIVLYGIYYVVSLVRG